MNTKTGGMRNPSRYLLVTATAILLAATAGTASAVEMQVLKLGSFNTVEIAILGSEDFVPDDVRKRGLILGWRQPGHDGGYVPAIRLRPARRDVNGDGYPDAIALFRLSESDFQDLHQGNSVLVELQGLHWDGGIARPFVAQATVLADDDPSSACTAVQNSLESEVGVRCIWTIADGSAYKPIVTQQLVADLNDELGATSQIASTSAVVIETYGGKGKGGANTGGIACTAVGGSAGGPGYTRTVTSVGLLPDLFIYPGESAGGNGGGGASSVVSSVDLASLSEQDLGTTTAEDLAGLGILSIAGGGGGGGDGHTSGGAGDDKDCHHGGDGGAGGLAVADTSSGVPGGGGGGTAHGTPGDGGDETGGDGTPDGSGGIGGPGGAGYNAGISGTGGGAFWNGWSTADAAAYGPTAWTFGAGGAGSNSSGAGGAGFGGGGAADGENMKHKGGGGGGGSFAMQATVDSADLDSSLIYGAPEQTDATSQVVVTFELTASAQ